MCDANGRVYSPVFPCISEMHHFIRWAGTICPQSDVTDEIVISLVGVWRNTFYDEDGYFTGNDTDYLTSGKRLDVIPSLEDSHIFAFIRVKDPANRYEHNTCKNSMAFGYSFLSLTKARSFCGYCLEIMNANEIMAMSLREFAHLVGKWLDACVDEDDDLLLENPSRRAFEINGVEDIFIEDEWDSLSSFSYE